MIYQMPDYVYCTTTGDLGMADNKQQVYVAYADLTSEPECDDDGGCGAGAGDANGDGTLNILDIVAMVNYILGIGLASDLNPAATEVIINTGNNLYQPVNPESDLFTAISKTDDALDTISINTTGETGNVTETVLQDKEQLQQQIPQPQRLQQQPQRQQPQ